MKGLIRQTALAQPTLERARHEGSAHETSISLSDMEALPKFDNCRQRNSLSKWSPASKKLASGIILFTTANMLGDELRQAPGRIACG
jgi:hypothetical protein